MKLHCHGIIIFADHHAQKPTMENVGGPLASAHFFFFLAAELASMPST